MVAGGLEAYSLVFLARHLTAPMGCMDCLLVCQCQCDLPVYCPHEYALA